MEINKPTTTASGSTKVEPTYAFPMVGQIVTKVNPITGQQDIMSFVQTGMELRDYFACSALNHKLPYFDLQEPAERGYTTDEMRVLARECYAIADAMLAERSKVKP